MENRPPQGEYVLDSYALLAYLEDEPGSGRVGDLLETAGAGKSRLSMCVVNLGEVIYIIERERGLPKAQETLAIIDELPVEIVDAGRALTLVAAHTKSSNPIAFADCFAVALALEQNATLVTGDPEFGQLSEGSVKIEWL